VRAFFYYFVFFIGLALPITVLMRVLIGLLFHKTLQETLLDGVVSGLTLGVFFSVIYWLQRWRECPKCNEKQELLPSFIRFGGWKCKKCSAIVDPPPATN
jgi:hypothetical protein